MVVSNSKIVLRDYQQQVFIDTYKAFNDGYTSVLVQLPCRSGKSYIIADICNKAKGDVLILAHRIELLKQLSELITSLHIKNVRLASVFTEARNLGKYDKPTIIIIDEAHLSEASSYKKVVEYYDTNLIGFSATPTRLDGKPLSLYKKLICGISTKELIKKGAIAPFDYYAPDIALDLSDIGIIAGEYNNKELTDLMCKSQIYGDVIKYYKKLAGDKQAIAYCVSVKHSKTVCNTFVQNDISAIHIDGGMNKKAREKALDEFKKGKYKILCNCNLISEGITLPNASVGLLLRPTNSLPLYIQQAMRVLTPDNNKHSIIIDFVANFQHHGLPDEDRDWSLEGVTKKRRTTNEDGTFIIRNCPNCFKTFKTANKCPYCGHTYEVKGRELKQIQEVELKKITEKEKQALEEQKKKMRMEVGKARSRAELIKIAKQRGYNMQWVNIQCRIKNI